jgi:hypothetical protein
VFSHLSQKELVHAREVCRTWRGVVDEHFQFTVIIHEDKVDLDRIRHIKVKDCLISRLLTRAHFLSFPDELRRLRIWGPTLLENSRNMIRSATRLEELSLTRFPLMEPRLFPNNQAFKLDKLVKLELLGYHCKDNSEEIAANAINLLHHSLPELRKIFVNITSDCPDVNLVFAALLELLAKKKDLSHVNAALVPDFRNTRDHGNTNSRPFPNLIPIAVRDALYNEDESQLQLTSLRLSLASNYLDYWAPIINKQRKLEDFRVNWGGSDVANGTPMEQLGIPCSLLYKGITQSASTLVVVELKDLNLSSNGNPGAAPFNGNIFRQADNLKRLVLVRSTSNFSNNDIQRGGQLFQISMLNMDHIFPVLEHLEIVRFKCRSYDLQFLVDNAPLLKNVKLQHNGSTAETGVHGGIVQSIAAKPSIMILNVGPVNYFDAVENAKLDSVKIQYDGICAAGDRDHLYFDFDRFRRGVTQPRRVGPQRDLFATPPSPRRGRGRGGYVPVLYPFVHRVPRIHHVRFEGRRQLLYVGDGHSHRTQRRQQRHINTSYRPRSLSESCLPEFPSVSGMNDGESGLTGRRRYSSSDLSVEP